MSGRRLYEVGESPYCRKARWVLGLKRLSFVTVEVDPREPDTVIRIAGEWIVPLLADGDGLVGGSTAIAHYLERACPEPSVFPPDPRQRNQAVTFDEFGDHAIGAVSTRLLSRPEWTGPGVASATTDDTSALTGDLETLLVRVREGIARGALDGDGFHLGDLSVAAHLETCRLVPGLRFAEAFADLAAYATRVRQVCER